MMSVRWFFFVGVPLVSLLLSAPILTEVLPFEVRSGDYHWQFWLVGLAAALALIAAPGYLYAVFRRSPAPLNTRRKWWLRASLSAASVASVIGTGFTILAFWPLAFLPLASLGMCIWLWIEMGREDKAAAPVSRAQPASR
jgi:hypothetical protein